MKEQIHVCVIGLGYIGLPTAALLASCGYRVSGVDTNQETVNTINKGQVHILEPGLDALVASGVAAGHLQAHTRPVAAEVYLIAVPTPFKDDHQPDLRYVEAAVDSIIPVLPDQALLVLESTSPVGTTDGLVADRLRAAGRSIGKDVFLAYCPERVLPGQIIRELVSVNRSIGGVDAASTERAMAFYQGFVEGELVPTSARTAEMAKLTENAFRDVNIAFANELSVLCDKMDLDVWELIALTNRHPRVNVLQPGAGVGGHCIAVDPWFVISQYPEQARLMHAARLVNNHKPAFLLQQVAEKMQQQPDAIIACLGVAFKPDVDDVRESPAMAIAQTLWQRYPGQVRVCEPNLDALAGDMQLSSLESAVHEADVVLVLVAHAAFSGLAARLRDEQLVIDAPGVLSSFRS